jgi:hypothetical protein
VRRGEAHGKKKQLTTPAANGVERPLPCTNLKNARQRLGFAVRQPEKHTTKIGLCRAPAPKTHGKGPVADSSSGHFAVRLPKNARQSVLCIFFLFCTYKNHQKS